MSQQYSRCGPQREEAVPWRAALLPLVLAVQGCTWLFPFAPLSVEEKEEMRLPPPPQAPLFTDGPRFHPTPEAMQGYGTALATGHFTRRRRGRPDLELAVGVPEADDGLGRVVRYRKDAGAEDPETLSPGDYGIRSAQPRFGAALVAADFDGDRYDDLAIGAPGDGNGGSIVVVYGGGNRWTRLLAPAATGRRGFGTALAASDLDGDGRADLVIGEPGVTRAGAGDPPRVWVLWGRRQQLLVMAGRSEIRVPLGDEQQNASGFGSSLSIGNFVLRSDLSQPQLPDIAVGAPKFDRTDIGRSDVGRVYVFRPASPAPQVDGFILAVTLEPRNGWQQYASEFGHSLVGGNFNGDVNGTEPKDDLVIGAPLSSIPQVDGLDTTNGQPSGEPQTPGAGLVFIAPHGMSAVSTSLRVLSQDRMGLSQRGDHFGWSLTAGDFNVDGLDDLVVGSPNERLAGPDVSGVKQAGALYFRFGVSGAWNVGGGIPQVPQSCFDYIDAVRGAGDSRASDRFGSSVLQARFDDDDFVDLIVGAPLTDVTSGDSLAVDSGAVWVGRNQETLAGPFEGVFTGSFRDDDCGGNAEAALTLDVRNREDAVCGLLTTNRNLCFEVDDEPVTVNRIAVAVVANNLGRTEMHLEYVVRSDGRKVGTLVVDAVVPDPLGDLTVDLGFRGQGVRRSMRGIVLERQ
jgi:hypothetical protein